MNTKSLKPGDRVYTITWDGLVLVPPTFVAAINNPGSEVREVDHVARNVAGGGKATNRVHFTDGTSTLAAASSDWIMA